MPRKAILLLIGLSAPWLHAQQRDVVKPFAVRDVRLFDGERVSEHRTVLVQDGIIRRVGGADLALGDADVVDGRGRTLLPGLIDAHVHLDDGSNGGPSQAISLGVTTMLEMWNGGDRLKAIKKIQRDDALDVADIRTAGTGATAAGGHPSQMGVPPFPTLTGPAEVQAFVDARLAEGSDYIKIIYDDLTAILPKAVPMLDRATLEALVQAAHRRQRLAVVHVTSEQQARDAIRAGADGLAHLFVGSSASSDSGSWRHVSASS